MLNTAKIYIFVNIFFLAFQYKYQNILNQDVYLRCKVKI